MVLSPPALDAPPSPASPEKGWLDRLIRPLKLADRQVMVLVAQASPAGLRPALCRLLAELGEVQVRLRAPELAALAPGSVALLRVVPEDILWLNYNRPLVSERRLKLVLWAEGEVASDLTLGEYDVVISSVPQRETLEAGHGKSPSAQRDTADVKASWPGAVAELRKHVAWYANGLRGASELRRRANAVASAAELLELLGNYKRSLLP